MKKSMILGLLALSASATQSFGQGVISLDNYNTSGPLVRFGSSSGPDLTSGFTAGFYYAMGNVTGSVRPDPTLEDEPIILYSGFTLATGPGSTALFDSGPGAIPGEFQANNAFPVPGTFSAGGETITLMVVAYIGSSYDSAELRAHSDSFVMTTSANTASPYNEVGAHMPAFFIPVPEPSIASLAGVGGLILWIFRCRSSVQPHETPAV